MNEYAPVNGPKLYGGLGSIEMLGEIPATLAKSRQVIADIDRPLSFEAMADDIAALITHFGLGPEYGAAHGDSAPGPGEPPRAHPGSIRAAGLVSGSGMARVGSLCGIERTGGKRDGGPDASATSSARLAILP